ncbi:MAG: V-type ATP synthase subunit B [Planctomycetes bacterium]|nr:V-type ATP synthase subunit B [Planctomycetota bacterium]
MRWTTDSIRRIAGNVIEVQARGVGYGELALVSSPGAAALAQIIRLDGDAVFLQVLGGTAGLSSGDSVRFLERALEAPFTPHLLGRVFDGKGEPRDGGPRLLEATVPVGGPPVNPVRRLKPSRMIRTAIPMIDLFNSLVESQKISIFTVAGEPYLELLARIALQADAEVIVLGGMGLRYDDYLFLRDTLESAGAAARTVAFVHTAADPVVECIAAPDLALAVAERFALAGRRVLVLLTDMTSFCDALKEVAIVMEQVPSNRGYPGDLYSQLAARYEKAVAFEGAGSVTLLSVTTLPGNDITHPVPDNTGYITEGQYYLQNGRIEPFGSLSRLKQHVNAATRADHRTLMDAMIRLYAGYQETLEKRAMGFALSPWDGKLMRYGTLFEARLMDLGVAMTLETALDLGWRILADCFAPAETGIGSELLADFWPREEAGRA